MLIFSDWENMEGRSNSILSPLAVSDWKNLVSDKVSDPIVLSFSDIVFYESEASISVDAYNFSHALFMYLISFGSWALQQFQPGSPETNASVRERCP